MGRPKSLVPLAGMPLIEHVAARLSLVCRSLLVVCSDPDLAGNLPVPVVPDPAYEGPLAGIMAGLQAAAADPVVVVACDMPLLDPAALTFLLSRIGDQDAVVPRDGMGRLHPLHAVYRKVCASDAHRLLSEGQRRADALARTVRTVFVEASDVDPSGHSFTSVDTPEQLLALARATPGRGPDQPLQDP